MKPPNYLLIGLPIALIAFASACMAETKLVIAGSHRMAPLLRELAEGFEKARPGVAFTITSGGSKKGIEALGSGATAAALARAITPDEARKVSFATEHDPVGTPIAMDAVVFYVHRDNPIASLTVAHASAIFRGRLQGWLELDVPLDPAPDHKHGDDCALTHPLKPLIKAHMLYHDSGSAVVMSTAGMGGKAFPGIVRTHERSGEVIAAVSKNHLAIGLAGLAAPSGTRPVPLAKTESTAPVLATVDSIQQRIYPLAHYLYLYSAGEPNETLRAFLGFVISKEGQDIVRRSKTGLVPLPIGMAAVE